jgi:hypothetical protein
MNEEQAIALGTFLQGVFPTITPEQKSILQMEFQKHPAGNDPQIRTAITQHYLESKFVEAPCLLRLIKRSTGGSENSAYLLYETETIQTLVRLYPKYAGKSEPLLLVSACESRLRETVEAATQRIATRKLALAERSNLSRVFEWMRGRKVESESPADRLAKGIDVELTSFRNTAAALMRHYRLDLERIVKDRYAAKSLLRGARNVASRFMRTLRRREISEGVL